MNKTAELTAVVGAIIAFVFTVIVTIAFTGTVATATWDISQGFVAVIVAIFAIGAVLIASETKKEKQRA